MDWKYAIVSGSDKKKKKKSNEYKKTKTLPQFDSEITTSSKRPKIKCRWLEEQKNP